MPEGERKPAIPPWAKQERQRDISWITEYLYVFWPAAQASYAAVGRGALVVDATVRPTGAGHPFGYFTQEQVVAFGDPDASRMVVQYEPEWQFVTMLLKPEDRVSTYRIGVPNR